MNNNNNTLFNNHPLISNSNQYFYEKKYVSVHSEDRDYTKFPSSAEFEVTLPQELLNIASARLYSWSFPANYSVFSAFTYNVAMTFKFITLYNPGEVGVSDPLLEGIFAALYKNIETPYIINIEPGFYNPDQMANELTNKFNEAVTVYISAFFTENATEYAQAKSLFSTYNRFHIVYNSVEQKLWFGNTTDKFILTNDSTALYTKNIINPSCLRRVNIPEYGDWGLPAYLGFSRCPAMSFSANEQLPNGKTTADLPSVSSTISVPRFYYGDSSYGSGDDGYWLLPGAPDATVYFLQAPFKISFMGPAYIYMEVDGMNCIDETSPWNLSEYTNHNNQTNGRVSSSFAKIPVPTTPLSQWFDSDMSPYKYWNPPAERLSKIKVKFRYHNNQLVDFAQFEYSFMIEFNILRPQQERAYSVRNALDLSQTQSYSSKFV